MSPSHKTGTLLFPLPGVNFPAPRVFDPSFDGSSLIHSVPQAFVQFTLSFPTKVPTPPIHPFVPWTARV